jgi:hypothetical protein
LYSLRILKTTFKRKRILGLIFPVIVSAEEYFFFNYVRIIH